MVTTGAMGCPPRRLTAPGSPHPAEAGRPWVGAGVELRVVPRAVAEGSTRLAARDERQHGRAGEARYDTGGGAQRATRHVLGDADPPRQTQVAGRVVTGRALVREGQRDLPLGCRAARESVVGIEAEE